MNAVWRAPLQMLCCICLSHAPEAGAQAADLTQTVVTIKPSVVAIATMQKSRSPPIVFFGTGFAVADGVTVLTNAHVVAQQADTEKSGVLGVLVSNGTTSEFRPASLVAVDKEHDLAALKIAGAPLPALKLGDSGDIREGQSLAFTGFPLGMVLGLHHATHRATLAAITPIVQPAFNVRGLDAKAITQLRQTAFEVFQLDGTAYPGNSGSPIYDPSTGLVYGIINMVFVKGLKENAISTPSGISYAIPSNYLRTLLDRQRTGGAP